MKDNVNVNNNSKNEVRKERQDNIHIWLIVLTLIFVSSFFVFLQTKDIPTNPGFEVVKMIYAASEKNAVTKIKQKFHRKYDYPVWINGKQPTKIRIYDSADEDGDVVEVNGLVIPLTNRGIELTIESKMEELKVRGVKDGVGGITLGIDSYNNHTTNVVLDRVGDTVTVPIISYY